MLVGSISTYFVKQVLRLVEIDHVFLPPAMLPNDEGSASVHSNEDIDAFRSVCQNDLVC